MKKEYVRPEWYKDEFCLNEHIAKGCTPIKIEVVPGTSVTVDRVCCRQVADKDPGTGTNGGKGHWDGVNVTIKDDNSNGRIDWAEIVHYVGTAMNGVVTGGGHENHQLEITLPGEEIITGTPENS